MHSFSFVESVKNLWAPAFLQLNLIYSFFFPELESDRTNQKYFVKFPTRQNPNGNWIDFSSCVYVNESVSVWQNFASAKKARREKYMLN